MTRNVLAATNLTRGSDIGATIAPAASLWERVRGLLGRTHLEPGEGLHIVPCSSVHTWFMRFPIDVLYLSRDGRVVKGASLKPFRYSRGGRGAHSALELPSGTIRTSGTVVGDHIAFESRPA